MLGSRHWYRPPWQTGFRLTGGAYNEDVLMLDLVTDPKADPRQQLIDRTRGLTRGTLRKLLRQVPATTSRRDAP